MSNFYNLRREYLRSSLLEDKVIFGPLELYENWWQEALAQELEANAFTLSTVNSHDLQPTARILLLKAVRDDNFIFFSNYTSRKGCDLDSNPRACMSFFWAKLERQVIILGKVSRLSRSENMHYFASRPRESQLSAWASEQSKPVSSRIALEKAREQYAEKFLDQEIPCPPNWGGFQLEAHSIEFWQGGAYRLHDRLLYKKDQQGNWQQSRIAP